MCEDNHEKCVCFSLQFWCQSCSCTFPFFMAVLQNTPAKIVAYNVNVRCLANFNIYSDQTSRNKLLFFSQTEIRSQRLYRSYYIFIVCIELSVFIYVQIHERYLNFIIS